MFNFVLKFTNLNEARSTPRTTYIYIESKFHNLDNFNAPFSGFFHIIVLIELIKYIYIYI